MRIRLSGLYVHDQEKALAFYTERLGFRVHTDAAMGDERWLTLVSPEEADGTQLLLEPANEAARALQRSLRELGAPSTAFTVDDCRAEHERLSAAGVAFTMPPTTMPYGGIDAVFDDECGNLICIHQDAPPAVS